MRKTKKQKKFIDLDTTPTPEPTLPILPFREDLSFVPTVLNPPKKNKKSKKPPTIDQTEKSKTTINLNHLANFKIDDGDPFISSDEDVPQPKPEFKFVQLKDKSQYEYSSVFNVGTTIEDKSTREFIEQFVINDYINIIKENFTEMSRVEIITKLFLYNCDVEKLLKDLYSEKEFPFLTEESKQKYMTRNIKSNKEIEEDLHRLFKTFPLLEEKELESLYFNHQMDLYQTKNYITANKLTDLKVDYNNPLSLAANKVKVIDVNKEKKKIENSKSSQCYLNESQIEALMNNNFEQNEQSERIDVNEYKAIRAQLLRMATAAFSRKKHMEGYNFLAKAKEYKFKIENQIKRNKISSFVNNNVSYSKEDNIVDLHGLNLPEAKMIIEKKLSAMQKENSTLKVITGKGNHSENNIPVLYPEIIAWLDKKAFLKVKGELSKGYILVIST